MSRSLSDWLAWQESLHPREIELRLDRCARVAERLELAPPPGRVFTVAGTNGKGSTAWFLESLARARGWRTGLYTSPHLMRYNDRIRIDSRPVSDAELVAACEAVEAVRHNEALTYFEFGTLTALYLFDRAQLDTWLLEVGLGGRLDAVNIIDPDYSLITTVAIDHADWLGNTVEAIAYEKAGILRSGRPGFFGEAQPPASLTAHAGKLGVPLQVAGSDFGFHVLGEDTWQWQGAGQELRLDRPSPGDHAQLANLSLALAAAGACDAELVSPGNVARALQAPGPPGRFQTVHRDGRDWLLDVAHNPHAAQLLAKRLAALPAREETTAVVGLHRNKDLAGFLEPLVAGAQRWVCCRAGETAGLAADSLAAELQSRGATEVHWRQDPAEALALAERLTAPGGRVLVCGSFEVVGPAQAYLEAG